MRLLAENPAVDAVFAACDVTAIGVLKALTATGRRVPDDVAVVGFDGSALADAADLTSVYSPVESEAAIAVRTLLDPSTETAPLLATHLVVRSTT
jgi:DNA-binding LacI/PurR family transcriptional regulator